MKLDCGYLGRLWSSQVGKKTGMMFSIAAVAVVAPDVAAVGASSIRRIETRSCRARLYLQKAEGGVSELSWTELWEVTGSRKGVPLH